MQQVIVFQNKSGGVSVCAPTGEISIEAVLAKDVPVGANARVVTRESLPNADGDFFDAWELGVHGVTVNLDKARDITKNRLRRERAPLLAAQDVAFQRALETGADTSEIVAEKERLRGITVKADTCNTTSELRSLTCSK